MASALAVMEAYVAGQARLGYAPFDPGPRPTDVILAAFPKSGSTWTSYLMHELRSGGDHDFGDIKHEVVDITPGHWDPSDNPFTREQRFHPRTFKTHGSRARCPTGARHIYVARDPQDGFVSLYHFIHDLFRLEDRAPVEDFFRHYYVERFGTGHDIGCVWDHLLGWMTLRGRPEMLWLHYEDLLEDLPRCLRAIATHMGLNLDAPAIAAVVDSASMPRMRAIADKLNPSPDNYVGKLTRAFSPLTAGYAGEMRFGKLRTGRAGEGRVTLSADMRARFDDEWARRITPVLGFQSYADMRAAWSLFSQ
jgi:hypothetical protein